MKSPAPNGIFSSLVLSRERALRNPHKEGSVAIALPRGTGYPAHTLADDRPICLTAGAQW